MQLELAGKQIVTVNGKLAVTHFISKTRQLFETEEGSFVYKMDEKLVYKLKDDTSYTRLLLKILTLEEQHNV